MPNISEMILSALFIGIGIAYAGLEIAHAIKTSKPDKARRPIQVDVLWAWDCLYVFFWDTGTVLVSSDKGITWEVLVTDLGFHGNHNYRF